MQLPSAATPSAAAYAKVEKMDAEEARHLKAQYLIHKVLVEATASAARPPRRRHPALATVRARIGVRLKKLRLAIRGVRVRARRAVRRHLRSLRRLIARGGQGSSVKLAATGSPS
ncbi:hypothetical protein SETIT_2G332100v2 [Setaria italica]|uniref:Uncharacterized protein n=1 Tax=Setaria italica TaxID=4555 RepID=K4A1D4_SETIT|nr:hypothetical protein SETIT_2G332100v2 [Setaria italica]